MRPFPTDLFDEVPVTWQEVNQWCDRIVHLSATPWRRDWYVRNWNVIGKIQSAKLAGTFYSFIAGQ